MKLVHGLRAIVFLLPILMINLICPTFAADLPPPTFPPPSGVVLLKLLPSQLHVLRDLNPLCAAKLVGNAVERSNVAAVQLSATARPRCLLSKSEINKIRKGDTLRSEDRSTNAVIVLRVIALRQRGVNLLRVDQNYGGSGTVVRFVVVSVVRDRRSQVLLLVRELLPPSIASNGAARAYANERKY